MVDIDDEIVRARGLWLNERPKIPVAGSKSELIEAHRRDYRYHQLTKTRLEKQKRAIESMIEDCEIAMLEDERFVRECLS